MLPKAGFRGGFTLSRPRARKWDLASCGHQSGALSPGPGED